MVAVLAGLALPAFHPFRGWSLFFVIVAGVFLLLIGWIGVRIFTRSWDARDQRESRVGRPSAGRARARKVPTASTQLRQDALLRIRWMFESNRAVFELALAERRVWPDRSNGPVLLHFDYQALVAGGQGVVREALARSQDADQAMRNVLKLAVRPGLGEAISTDDEDLITDTLKSIAAALESIRAAEVD
jgi:hypothetical protein